MIKQNLPVSDFRDKIDFAHDEITVHWHACVNKQEQVKWFIRAIKRFNDLSQVGSKRAKERDNDQYQYVFDLFAVHCHRNESLWREARVEILERDKLKLEVVH